jgi:subtilisin family serine protease
MMQSDTSRFLVRFRDASRPAALRISARLGITGTEVVFATGPLFQSVGLTRHRGVAASGGAWRLAVAQWKFDDGGAWDHCHAIVEQNASVAFVEADLERRWTWHALAPAERRFGIKTGGAQPQDIGDGYAGDLSDDYWSRNDGHGQFDAALTASGGGTGVRIAHLDTGFDPDHKSVPKNLRPDLARNFVDGDRPNDATDRAEEAAFNKFGHGRCAPRSKGPSLQAEFR